MRNAVPETGTNCTGRIKQWHVIEFVNGREWLGRLLKGNVYGSSVCPRFIPEYNYCTLTNSYREESVTHNCANNSRGVLKDGKT